MIAWRPAIGSAKAAEPANAEAPRANILASGVGGRWALEAQRLLAEDWGVAADVWSATSWNELAREARACDEWNLLNPEAEQRVPYVTRTLDNVAGPIVAVSDFTRAVPDQIAVDLGVPRLGPFEVLEHDHARPAGVDEAVARHVVGPAGLGRRAVEMRRHGPHGIEQDGQGPIQLLAATGEHQVLLAPLNELCGIADAVGRRCASR